MKRIKIINFILFLFLVVGCKKSKLAQIEEKNIDYIEQITELTEKLAEVSNDKDELLVKLGKYEPEVFENGECTFTKTYRIVDIMDYKAEDDSLKFIVIDQFQVQEPFIIKLTKDQVSQLKKDEHYEFTFEGKKKYKNNEKAEIFDKFELIELNKTDKVGLNQLQESCSNN